MLRLPVKQRHRRPHKTKPAELPSFWSGPGAASKVQGRRRSPRRCWPANVRAPDLSLRRPLLVAIRADLRRSKPAELRVHVPKRAAQLLVGPRGRQRGPGPTEVPAAAGRHAHEHPTRAPDGRCCGRDRVGANASATDDPLRTNASKVSARPSTNSRSEHRVNVRREATMRRGAPAT